MIVASPSPSRVAACSASALKRVREDRSGLGGGCAALRVDERLREGHVLGEREVADRLVAPERAVEVPGGADEVSDHLVHVPLTAQQRGSPLRGVSSRSISAMLAAMPRRKISRGSIGSAGSGSTPKPGRTAILCGVEHSAAEVARGSRSGEGTQERGGLLQTRRFGRGGRIGAQPRLDGGPLLGVERVEGQRGQLVLEVFVQRHDEMPSASSVSASLRSANRMRDFAVPSGMPRIAATST